MRRRTKLSTRILVSELILLVVTVALGFGLYAWQTYRELDNQYQQRALAVAQSAASVPQVQQALLAGADGDHDEPADNTVQQVAERIRRNTDALYVVVINPSGVRLSYPNGTLVGQNVDEPVVAMDGQSHVRTDNLGALGVSANGRAPVFGPDGRVVGEVSAGILERNVTTQLLHDLPVLALYIAGALGIGVLGSVLLARRLKRTTFGLELHEIARLLQEREAMLHGVREGVITLSPTGEVTLVNDEARRLLGLRSTALGQKLDELLPEGRLRDVLAGTSGSVDTDQIVLTDERSLIVNRMSVALRGRDLGSVVTLRDRTEVEGLVRELTSTRGLTDALRAQQHEFANRMHTVVGLISLGEADEAVRYLTDTVHAADDFAAFVRERINSRVVAALVLAKASVAAERDVTLLLTEDSTLPSPPADPDAVVTILGNLIDNAIDAARLGPPPAHVTVRLVAGEERLIIRVSDTGPGIPAGAAESIFREGFSTKPAGSGVGGRGLGLALVDRVVRKLGGTIAVTEGPAAAFTVMLPARVEVPR
ncbi:MAG TPA: sensor histidine kinase [Pseudonocardiaceae bacterium]|jgi:two-component system CitB family sensor kinase|nr:sensor histidine kinase [Pseudonocardiaceae bacterium]